MCGIFGIVSKRGDVDAAVVSNMTDLVAHRGPDGRGILVKRNVGLGHRRLAVIDLSDAGAQPMRSPTAPIWIVFNGEIYNFRELRSELSVAGHEFRTATDTEVLLAAYLEWGPGCLERLNGMWSFAIFDERHSTVFCARDRFGVKPFYFADTESAFVFGSEIRQILDFLDQRSADQELVKDFLVTGLTDHTDRTFFRGVEKLAAGHMLKINSVSGDAAVSRFYALRQIEPSGASHAEAPSRIRALFEDSVRIRLRSDIRVGSCLSGGLDSSSITALGSRREENSTQSFYSITAVSDGNERETQCAGLVSREFRLEWRTLKPTYDDFSSSIGSLIEAQEEPFAGPSVMMQYLVMQQAKKDGIAVLLDGQGADEVFLGYPRYFPMWFVALMRKQGLLALMGAVRSVLRSRPIVDARTLLNYSLGGGSAVARELFHRMRYPFLKDKTLPRPLIILTQSVGDPAKTQTIEIECTSLPMLLRFEDKNSMRFGVETRLPFLDFRLVEFALSLPLTIKISDGWLKWPLRVAMVDRLPGEICWRRDKVGFAAPETDWLTRHDTEMKSVIQSSRFLEHFVDTKELERKFSSVDLRMKWRLYCLSLWAEKFGVLPN